MVEILEQSTAKKSVLLTERAVSLQKVTSTNGGMGFEKKSDCPQDDKETRKLLKHCCERIAAKHAQWKRNTR